MFWWYSTTNDVAVTFEMRKCKHKNENVYSKAWGNWNRQMLAWKWDEWIHKMINNTIHNTIHLHTHLSWHQNRFEFKTTSSIFWCHFYQINQKIENLCEIVMWLFNHYIHPRISLQTTKVTNSFDLSSLLEYFFQWELSLD